MRFSSVTQKAVLAVGSAALGILAGLVFRQQPVDPSPSSGQKISAARGAPGNVSGTGRKGPRLPQTAARIAWLRQAGTPSRQIAAALELASLTSIDEIRDLLDHSGDFPDSSAEEVGIGTLLRRWLELDPGGAVKYCQLRKPEFLGRLAGDWHRVQPEEAEAFVKAMPPGEARTSAWVEICQDTARRAPEKAWEILARTLGMDTFYGTWRMDSEVNRLVRQDPEKALATIGSMPPAILQPASKAIVAELTKSDPQRGWEWARSQANAVETTGIALGIIVASDPAQALEFLKTVPSTDLRRVIEQSAGEWQVGKVKDFAAMLRADSGIGTADKQALAQSLFNNVTWSNPAEAGDLVPLLDPEWLEKNIFRCAQTWFSRDAASLKAWVETLPEGPVREAALMAQTAVVKDVTDAPGADQPESLKRDFAQGQYINPTDPRLATVTGEQVGELAAEMPDSQSGRLQAIMAGLAGANPAAACQWLEQQTVLDAKTGPAAAQFSAIWAENDPAAAAAWVKTLPAGELSRVAAQNVIQQYMRYDPAAASAWRRTLQQDARDGAFLGILRDGR